MGNIIVKAFWKADVEVWNKVIVTVNDPDVPGILMAWDKDHEEWRIETDYPILTRAKKTIAKIEIEELDVTKYPDFIALATHIVYRNDALQSENAILREQLKRYGIQDHWPYNKENA